MYPHFFSLEEIFVRLGQNREKGCLVAFNKNESAHIFVENSVVTCALADKRYGEDALAHALAFENAGYSWIPGVDPSIKNLQLSIAEYALKHFIAKDTKIGKTMTLPKQATKALPPEELAKRFVKKSLNLDFVYYFTDEEFPTAKHILTKISNVVGRDESCDLILLNAQVSRRHCVMQVTERGIMVKDLDSTNGTYVNGFALSDGYINRGDRLFLGSYELTLHVEKNMGHKVGYQQ
jgi:hypothetical protein